MKSSHRDIDVIRYDEMSLYLRDIYLGYEHIRHNRL